MLAGIRQKTVLVLVCLLIALVLAGCGGRTESAANIEAKIGERQAEDAVQEANSETMAKAMVEATPQTTPTAAPIPPTSTPTPVPTPNLKPTFPPSPLPTATITRLPPTPTSPPIPTQVPPTPTLTATSVVTPTPTATPTAIPTNTPASTPVPPTSTPVPTIIRDELDGVYPCTERGTKIFTSSVFPVDLITHIEPMGKMASSHVTPTDHLYVHRDPWVGEDNDYVLAPADGWIVEISNNEERTARWDASITVPDHRLLFMHSCTFFTIFIHLGELAPAVIEQTGEIPPNSKWFSTRSAPVQVSAGEPIAKMGLTGFDWSVHDTDTTLTGFVIPDHYEGENWKIHTADPFQFYNEPLKSGLLTKSIREVEPRAGKIDHDVEDTLVGNWFLDGTVGYKPIDSGGGEYWKGHLAMVYDWIDPTKIRISIGSDTEINDDQDCNVCFGNYAVLGNKPDPATIGPEAGLVKFELMSRTGPNHVEVGNISLGTFLVQHLGDRTIRVEVIAGTAPDEVTGFSDASLIYRR